MNARFRVEENSQAIRAVYRPELKRWASQVLGYHTNPVTLLAEDHCVAVVYGRTESEAETYARVVRDALNAAGVA